MTSKLRLNPYPNALAVVVVLHGFIGFGNDFAMVVLADLFFELVSMVGDGLASICLHFLVRHRTKETMHLRRRYTYMDQLK